MHLPPDASDRAINTIYAEILYAPYLIRETQEAKRTEQYQEMVISPDIDFTNMPGLSKELQQKLAKYRPNTIAAAALIPGMTPAALSLIIFKIKQLKKSE